MVFNGFWKILTALVLLVLFANVFASNQQYHLSLNFAEARSSSFHDFKYQQMAFAGDLIDIKASLFMDNWGSEPYKKAFAFAEIYGIKNNQPVLVEKTFTQYFYIFPYGYDYSNFTSTDVLYGFANYGYPVVYDYYPYGNIVYYYPYPYYDTFFDTVSYPVRDSKAIFWNNEFNADSQYSDYKIVVSTGFEGKGISDTENAYIHILANSNAGTASQGTINNINTNSTNSGATSTNSTNAIPTSTLSAATAAASTCGQIGFFKNDLALNENTSTNYSQKFINNSNSTFYIDSVSATTKDSFLSVQRNYFDPVVFSNGIGSIELDISAFEVSTDPIGTITVEISGHFADGIQCGSNQIQQAFNVTVNDVVQKTSTNIPDSAIYSTVGQSSGTFKAAQQPSTENFTILLQGNPECSDISLNPQDFELKPNETQYKSFSISNRSDEFFYIDTVFAENSIEGILTDVWSNPSAIEPNGISSIGVKATAFNSTNAFGSAIIRIRGHFSDGTSCYASDISRNTFKVSVSETPNPIESNRACSGFNFGFPSTQTLSANGKASFKIIISNPLNESATVRLSGNGFDLAPKNIYINSNSTKEETVIVSNASSGNTLQYYINYKCGAFSQSTVFEKENASVKEKTLGEKISLNVTTTQTGNGYVVKIELSNKSNETVNGTIELNVPSDWKVEGNTKVSIEPHQTKIATLNVFPAQALDKDFKANVSFKADGEKISQGIEFKAKNDSSKIFGAAFALLSNNAILIGLLIALLILAYATLKNRRAKEIWQKQ